MKKPNPSKPRNSQAEDNNPEPEGYPLYPPNEDIYMQFIEEQDIDPEDPTQKKAADEEPEFVEEEVDELIDDEIMITDLDVPGAELDDDDEAIGNEDEENNYYSIGGDNHKDLEEDQGEEEFPWFSVPNEIIVMC